MFSGSAEAAAAAAHLEIGTPPGFDELASEHEVLTDVYFGGRKIAEALAVTKPGLLRFRAPDQVLQKIPQAILTPELANALAQELATNSQLVCGSSNAKSCGALEPNLIGIVYDQDRFRVDVYVNPKFLRATPAFREGYLARPDSSLSLTDTIGFNAAGTVGGPSFYDVQNRTIVAFRNVRVRADTAISSGVGVLVDDLVAEVDQRELRYSGGLFWSPANDFIGPRRILGGGVGTQFDTWADHEALRSTPLIVFLSEPARVDLIVDSRLISSRPYQGGNVELDTAALPDGAYPVVVRIRHANGAVEEQQRFFVKSSQVAAVGHHIIFGYAGVLANTVSNEPISPSDTLFYQVGTARRVSNNVAIDASLFGTQHKSIIEAGGWLMGSVARVRAAALVSSAGDWGALLQVGTTGHGPFNMSVDLRTIQSRDGEPLVPLPSQIVSFDRSLPGDVQPLAGTYTQATASVGIRLLNGYLSAVGSYRKDGSHHADYTIGPSLTLPILTRNDVQFVLEASAQRTRFTTAAFAGVRVLLSSRKFSVGAALGHAYETERREPSLSRTVGNLSAQYSNRSTDGTVIDLEGDADRNLRSTTVHAESRLSSRFGDFRADLLKNIETAERPQYNVAFQTGMAVGANASTWGSRELEQSAIIVSLQGDSSGAGFTVLLDDVAKGEVTPGHRFAMFVPAYRTYRVRIVPTKSQNMSYDAADREVTVYPGNVRTLSWSAERYVTLFGQALKPDGVPIAGALMQSAKGIAETDDNGYFQIDVQHGDPITLKEGGGSTCQLRLNEVIAKEEFASVGKVICQ